MAKSNKRSAESLDPTRGKSAKQVKFTRNSRRQASPFEDDASDSEVDVGRLESQHFLAMSKTTATPKSSKHADTQKAEFQKMVDGSKEKIVGALKENVVDILKKSADQNAAFAELLSACCLPEGAISIDLSSSPVSSLMKPSSLPGYSKATAFLALSKDLLNIYDGVLHVLDTKAGSLSVGVNWDNDCRKLHGLLQAGRKVTEDQVSEVVRGHSKPVEKASADHVADPDAPHTWTEFAMVEGAQQNGPGWASAVKSAERGVRRLVRHLPADEYENR